MTHAALDLSIRNHVLALTSVVCVTMEFGYSFKHLSARSIRSHVALSQACFTEF